MTNETLIATGFLRNYAKVGYREKDNPEFRYEYLDDMIATIGRGILGVTVQCARCHNHKFDPIPQKDYYALQASLFGYVEVDHPLTTPEQAEAYEKQLADVNARAERGREKHSRARAALSAVAACGEVQEVSRERASRHRDPEAERSPGQVLARESGHPDRVCLRAREIDRTMKPEDLARKKELAAKLEVIEKHRPQPIPVAMGITDGDYRFTPDGAGR